jgi:hypothetical protein
VKSECTLVADYSPRGAAILFSYVQLAVWLAITAYLCFARIAFQRRRARSWNELVKRLRAGAGDESADAAAEMDRRFTSEAIARRVGDARGRRSMFRHAGAMMEMADYAERNGGAASAPAAANLRSHATAIRIATVRDFLRIPIQQRAK